ncbi:hypothetical protein HJFPF1_02474 [Paramyrothecium foliicola]|nr:hypothetical protein HJFPF1_02474 [Paramyrothecium foliicola]
MEQNESEQVPPYMGWNYPHDYVDIEDMEAQALYQDPLLVYGSLDNPQFPLKIPITWNSSAPYSQAEMGSNDPNLPLDGAFTPDLINLTTAGSCTDGFSTISSNDSGDQGMSLNELNNLLSPEFDGSPFELPQAYRLTISIPENLGTLSLLPQSQFDLYGIVEQDHNLLAKSTMHRNALEEVHFDYSAVQISSDVQQPSVPPLSEINKQFSALRCGPR